MQFYMIAEDGAASAALLPDAMIRVNVREGWQILSDIGHYFGVRWDHQNKPYNVNHPTTMRLRESFESFALFQSHYLAALNEWERRFPRPGVWCDWATNVPWEDIRTRLWGVDRWSTVRGYIVSAKRRQLSVEEVAALR